MKYLISVVLALISLQAIAGIYMKKDADGDVTYSDIPLNDAEPVSLSPANSVPSTTNTAPSTNIPANSPSTTTTAAEESSKSAYYNAFAITSPANNETIQNQPVITVKIAIDPELRAGDTIQVYLDGKAWAMPVAGTSIEMSNVERGEHTLFARLLDSNKQQLKQSDVIKIFVHRASVNFNKNALNSKKRLADLILN